jgi:hypothetical protein
MNIKLLLVLRQYVKDKLCPIRGSTMCLSFGRLGCMPAQCAQGWANGGAVEGGVIDIVVNIVVIVWAAGSAVAGSGRASKGGGAHVAGGCGRK